MAKACIISLNTRPPYTTKGVNTLKKRLSVYFCFIIITLLFLASCTSFRRPQAAQQTPSPTIIVTSIPEAMPEATATASAEASASSALNADIFSVDINSDNGNIIKYIIRLINHEETLGTLIEERNMTYTDGAYMLNMFTLTDEYTLALVVPEGADRMAELEYETMSLILTNLTDGWILENPTADEVSENMLDEYYDQIDAWNELNVESEYSGNFIQIFPPNQPAAIIEIDEQYAADIVEFLKNPDEKIIINDLKGTDEEYISYGAEIFLEDMHYKYPVMIWTNQYGKAAFGYAAEPVPVSSQAGDMVFELLTAYTGYIKIPLSDISGIVSVELKVGDRSKGIITDKAKVQEIADMLASAKNAGGSTKCPFSAQLILTKEDGTIIELVHATDGCSVFVLGTADYYMYESQEKLLEYFDMVYYDD